MNHSFNEHFKLSILKPVYTNFFYIISYLTKIYKTNY